MDLRVVEMMKQVILMCVLHFTMIYMFSLLMMEQVESFGSQCGGLNQRFHSAENRVLKNFVYNTKTVHNYVICGRECSMDNDCKSFNFYKDIKLCELSNTSRAEHPEDFFKDEGSMYFDEDENTPLFSLPDISFDPNRINCKTLQKAGYNISGIYTIYPDGFADGLRVYCDMDTDGGGWIVFQRRQDGSVDFYRNWTEYKYGFGELSGEFWLGNNNLLTLTSDDSQGLWELRVDLDDGNASKAFAKYEDFKIIGDNYTLQYGEYTLNSTAGDSLFWHKGKPFSTKDNDNNKLFENAAQRYEGAWWFHESFDSHLNGKYTNTNPYGYGILWRSWQDQISLKKCSMKIRQKT